MFDKLRNVNTFGWARKLHTAYFQKKKDYVIDNQLKIVLLFTVMSSFATLLLRSR